MISYFLEFFNKSLIESDVCLSIFVIAQIDHISNLFLINILKMKNETLIPELRNELLQQLQIDES